ncbi:MAG: glycosyltransferase family 4 protein [Anaerolineales bacterium]
MAPKEGTLSIVLLGTQMEVAGSQRNLLAQARWFHLQGHRVKAVFFYDKQGLHEKWQAESAFPVVSLNGWKSGSSGFRNYLRLGPALLRLFRLLRDDVDVIVAFTPHSNLLGLPLAWLAGVPGRIGSHRGYIEGSSKFMQRLHGRLTNSRLCGAMVAVSSQVRENAIHEEGARPERVVVIPNGIDPPAFKAGKRDATRTQLGVPESGLLLITVGRLTIQKGHTYLLDAIAQMAPRHPELRFAFAGEGPLRAELEAKAQQLGISKSILWLGIREDIGDLLSAADVFVQPSLWEGLSRALLEALFVGLPVLSTNVEGVTDVVEDGKSALLIPAGDVPALAKAMERMVGDAELRKRLARAGQEKAKAQHSLEGMCIAYEALMRKVLDAS